MPGTVTSPEQEKVLSLLNLRPDVQDQQQASTNPLIALPPLTAHVMQALTDARSEQAANDEAKKSVSVPTPSITTTTRVDPKTGHIVHDQHTTNIIVGNAQDNVQAAYDKPQQDLREQLAPYMAGTKPVLSGPELTDKLNSAYGRYRLSRELGESPLKAVVNAGIITQIPAARQSLGNQVQSERENAILSRAKEALPIIQEQDRQMRLTQADDRLERQLGKDDAQTVRQIPFYANDPSKDLENGAAAIGKSVDELTPRQQSAITNAAQVSRDAFERTRSTTAAQVRSRLSPADVAGITTPEQKQAFIQDIATSVPGGMKDKELDLLNTRVNGLMKEWQNTDTKQKLQIQAQQASAAAQNKMADVQARLAKGATGEAAIAGLDPGTQNTIKGIAEGRIDLTKVTSNRGNNRQQIAELVSAYDPTFSTATAPARAKTYQDFTSGPTANAITSINTVTHHLDTTLSLAKDLQNAPVQLWNRIANNGLNSVGDPRVVKFRTAADAVASEMAKVFKGTGAATDQEITEWRDKLNHAQSPAQLQGAINTMVQLMAGRISSLKDRYERGMGKSAADFHILSADSQRILKKNGIDPDAVENSSAAPTAQPTAGRVITDPNEALSLFSPKKQ